MEPEQYRTKQDRGVSALIWCLAILLCVAFIACMVVGAGFFRIMRAQSTLNESREAASSQRNATAVPATPDMPTPGIDPAPFGGIEATPMPTMDSSALENLPKMELNVQESNEMQVFASIPDVVEAASDSVVGIIHYQPNLRTGKLEEYASGSGFIVSESCSIPCKL